MPETLVLTAATIDYRGHRRAGPPVRLRPRPARRRRRSGARCRRARAGSAASSRRSRSAPIASRWRSTADLTPTGVARLLAELHGGARPHRRDASSATTPVARSPSSWRSPGERVGRLVLTHCDAFENFLPQGLPAAAVGLRRPGVLGPSLLAMHIRALRPHAAGLRPAHEASDSRRRTRGLGAPRAEQPRGPRRRPALHSPHRQAPHARRGREARSVRPAGAAGLVAEDRFFKQSFAERLAAAFPDARLEPIADAWTFVSEDQPGVLAGLIAEFAGSHSAGRTPAGAEPVTGARHPPAARTGGCAISGRTSPIASSRPRVAPICRSAALGCSPPSTPSAIHASMRSRWPGSASRSSRTAPSTRVVQARSSRRRRAGSDGRAMPRRDRAGSRPR